VGPEEKGRGIDLWPLLRSSAEGVRGEEEEEVSALLLFWTSASTADSRMAWSSSQSFSSSAGVMVAGLDRCCCCLRAATAAWSRVREALTAVEGSVEVVVDENVGAGIEFEFEFKLLRSPFDAVLGASGDSAQLGASAEVEGRGREGLGVEDEGRRDEEGEELATTTASSPAVADAPFKGVAERLRGKTTRAISGGSKEAKLI
jgi:hypothetical protein